jgi:glycosyltransferase involved in cell wall biosynthesis
MQSNDAIVIEGWRGINHSYALVNQYQILHLLQQGVAIRHVDVPFFNPRWASAQDYSGFTKKQIKAIQNVAPPDAADTISLIYRIAYPLDFSRSPTARVLVFGTSEFQTIDGMFVGRSIEEVRDDASFRIVTPSTWSKVGFERAGIRSDAIDVVPHGVDVDIFRPIERARRRAMRNSLGLDDDSFMLLSVGAMTRNKGLEDILQSFAVLRQRRRNVVLVLKDLRSLYGISAEKLVKKLLDSANMPSLARDLSENIRIIPNDLSRRQLAMLYNAADCYVSPYKAEGFGLTPLEASACGTPIVVTKGGATDDYFDSSLGIQVDATVVTSEGKTWLQPDLNSLISALDATISDRDKLDREQAHRIVARSHTWALVAKRLIDRFSG